MNLNYNNINVDSFSDDVKQQYAFPENKLLITNFLKGDYQGISSGFNTHTNLAAEQTLPLFGIVTLGVYSFYQYSAPAGKIVRERIHKSWSQSKLYSLRLASFAGIALPIYYAKTNNSLSNGYVE